MRSEGRIDMELLKKEKENTQEYCYFANMKAIDKKALRKIGFKFMNNDKIDGKKCEVWIREV